MKVQQLPGCSKALTRNAALFILLAPVALPALQAQSNARISDSMAQTAPAALATTPNLPAASAAVTPAPVATQPASVTEQADASARVGDVTRTLLQAQADGRVAAPRLPMMGVTADAGWQRYLDSFKHPLPEFFENKVAKSSAN